MKTQLVLFISLMLMHLIADYFLQSREMGQQKSSSWKMLFKHGWIQFLVFFFGFHAIMSYYSFSEFGFYKGSTMFLVFGIISFVLAGVNACIHMVIDKITWNAYKYSKYFSIRRRAHRTYPNGPQDLIDDRIAKDIELAKSSYQEDPWFYHTIGIDQFLHIITIAFVYQKFLFVL